VISLPANTQIKEIVHVCLRIGVTHDLQMSRKVARFNLYECISFRYTFLTMTCSLCGVFLSFILQHQAKLKSLKMPCNKYETILALTFKPKLTRS